MAAKAKKPRSRKHAKAVRVGPCLYVSGRSYLYRRQVPRDLQPILRRTVYKVGLGVIDQRRAQKLADDLSHEHDALFALIRTKGARPQFLAREAEARAGIAEAAREAELAFYSLPIEARDSGALASVRRGIREEAERQAGVWRRAAARDLQAKLPDHVREEFGDAGAVLDARENARKRVAVLTAALSAPADDPRDHAEELQAFTDEKTLRRDLEAAQEQLERLDAVVGPVATPERKAKGTSITAADDEMRKKRHLTPVTTGKYDLYRRHFTDLFGDIAVAEITYQHVDEYVDAVAGLPNANLLGPKERTLSVEELLELRSDRDLPAVGKASIIKHVDWLKAVLNYSEGRRWIASNPARKVEIPETQQSKLYAARRRAFSPKQLREIMETASGVWADDPRLWYLRLCVYSGARPDEAAQLDKHDIREEDGVHFADIHNLDGKTIKNESSVRRVPIHPELVALGFLDFVAERKPGRLFGFPRTKKGEHEHATRYFRDSILRHCSSCLGADGEPDKRLVWYSIRHSFADACRNGGVRDSVRWALMGHVEQGASGGYGEGFDLVTLAAEIAKVDPLRSNLVAMER